MSYKIGRCPECNHPIHVHTKRNKTIIKNACEHIEAGVTTRAKVAPLFNRNY